MDSNVTYLVKQDFKLTSDDRSTVFYLYRPIIGNNAHALYLMLTDDSWDLEFNIKYDLDHFLTLLQMSQDEWLKAKSQLEVIGLLKVLKRQKGTHYILKPQLPITPQSFFENEILIHYLEEKLGKKHLHLIREKFLEKEEYVDVTQSSLLSGNNLALTHASLDFLEVDKFLSGKLINNKVYLPYKKEIIKLSSYYNLTTKQVCNFILKSVVNVDNKNEFNYELFNSIVLENYQSETLYKKINGEQLNLEINENYEFAPSGMIEAKIKEMMSIEPIEYLTLLREHTKPTKEEIAIVRDLILKFNLKIGVVNCLIEYVWFKNNRRIDRKYCEKIANTFQQLNINTVSEAMNHLKTAYLKSQQAKFNKETVKISTRKPRTSQKKDSILNDVYWANYESNKSANDSKISDDELNDLLEKI